MRFHILCLLFLYDAFGSSTGSFGSRSSRGGGSFSHDIKTKSSLTNLYNQRVVSSRPVERPLTGLNGGQIGRFGVKAANMAGITTSYSGHSDRATHSGSLVTTADGKQWLVHKGPDFGKSSNTVVVDAKHMSNKWQVAGPVQNVGGKASVGDYVKTGGAKYNVRGMDCHDATKDMQKIGNN